ncbi:hypothetical protein ASE11_17450 [Hydrogenophaga sp. Root209]|uniref:hypothetical protein n=1 Tax=Hydrogenophaga sp. Root209 TaxID=1736490 RepID=UPI0006FE2574|nr:hypothetical protein [Hydrogenophaga sp. Root209]KRB96362.1 hypothetical protein ASE11_17450 [Hydrogenophaga sp. Root209]
MEISDHDDEHGSDHEGRQAQDEDLLAFSKIFGGLPEGEHLQMPPLPSLPPLPTATLAQSSPPLSKRARFDLSSSLGHSAPGSPKSTSPGPMSPRIDIMMVPTPRDSQGMVNEGAAWVTKLLKQMEAMSALSASAQAELMTRVPDMVIVNEQAKQDTLAREKDLRNRRIRTSTYAAMVMYWLTFGLGKVAGNAYGAAMVACGLPAAALYAPLFTMLGVPFTQVIFGEPYGGAWRSAGVSYGSPDQAAYINYQTAHALYIRAWLEGNAADEEKYRKIMNAIVDGLIKREGGKHADGSSCIPRRLRSNAKVPERHDDGTVKVGQIDPSRAVVGAARTRSFITDEIPVHTFTVLNGMSGAANLFWKLGMGSALARVSDMVTHTVLGSIAMISMFEWQNVWRAKYQGVDLSDGGHPAVLQAKKETARMTVELWRKRCTDAFDLIYKIEDMLKRVEEYRATHHETDVHWNDMLSYEATLFATHGQLRQSLKTILAAAKRSRKELNNLETRNARANQAAKRIMSSMVGESAAPEPWLDGAPLQIRSVARVLGYMTVLATTTSQAILLGMSLMEYDQHRTDAMAQAAMHNTTLVGEPLNIIGLTPDQMAIATFTASTVAANAIVGWTAKTLYGLSAWEYGIHGVAGIATRAIKGVRKCLGMAPDTTLPAMDDEENPQGAMEPADMPAYSSEDEGSGDEMKLPRLPQVRISGSSNTSGSSSSSSDHH